MIRARCLLAPESWREYPARTSPVRGVVTSVASFLVLGGGGGARPQTVSTEKSNLYARASERASETYIFRTPNTSARTINAVLFYYYGMALYRQYNDEILTLSMRASGASELRKFKHFHILKLLFPFIFCWYF